MPTNPGTASEPGESFFFFLSNPVNGALTNNRLTVKDSAGHEVAHDDYGIVPSICATLSAKF